jgi:enoyl-CoA hydratase
MFELEVTGHVAHLRLSRAHKLNAMGLAFWDTLPDFVRQIDENLEVRAAVLSGEGKAFSVGLDFFDIMPRLGMGSSGPDGERQRQLHQMIRHMQHAVTSVERCRVPVIAAIHGYCLGGGVDLVTACDIRLASQDALFGVREPKVAIVADIGTLQRLPRLVGAGVARELIYSGRDFDASYALAIGLVNRVLPDRQSALDAALDLAREIALNAPLAVQGSKRVMLEADRGAIDRELEYVATWNAAHLLSQDLGTAVAAFAAKKQPNFEGR